MRTDAYANAVRLGSDAHAGKTWNSGQPYTVHLMAVEEIITRFLPDSPAREPLMAAAWFHDAVEDTGMSLDLVEKECGPEVRTLVWAVTDEPGINRKERHEKTYPKIRNVAGAVALKLADRIANVEASAKNRGGYFDMYRKEYADFRQALYSFGQLEVMWAHLDSLMSNDPCKQAVKLADKLVAELRQKTDLALSVEFCNTLHQRFAVILDAELKPK